MKNFLDVNLEVKIFEYDTKKEMEIHKKEMLEKGWKCKRCGSYFLNPSSLVSDYTDEKNWSLVAEYYKEDIKENKYKNMCYETTPYWFELYRNEKEGVDYAN